MSDQPIVHEVLADVDAEPDAIIDAYGADSPEELVSGNGFHDPIVDDQLEADASITDLLADLSEVSFESNVVDSSNEPDPDENVDHYTEIALCEPSVTVVPGDGTAIDLAVDDRQTVWECAGVTLVGPRPSATRITGDDLTGDPDVSSPTDSSDAGTSDATRSDRSHDGDDELTLVGPDPKTTRIPSDSFGADTAPSRSRAHSL